MGGGQPNTPGIFGYVCAILLACCVMGTWTYVLTVTCSAVLDGTLGGVPIALMAAVIYAPMLALVAATYGLPVAIVGVLVVHFGLRRFADQRLHIAAAGVCAILLSAVYVHATGLDDVGPPLLAILASVGMGAAAGRAAVLPLVDSRRRLAAQGRLTGTARW